MTKTWIAAAVVILLAGGVALAVPRFRSEENNPPVSVDRVQAGTSAPKPAPVATANDATNDGKNSAITVLDIIGGNATSDRVEVKAVVSALEEAPLALRLGDPEAPPCCAGKTLRAVFVADGSWQGDKPSLGETVSVLGTLSTDAGAP